MTYHPLVIPEELTRRYRGQQYISRMPFLLNSYVQRDDVMSKLGDRRVGEKDIFIGIPGLHTLDILANLGTRRGKGYQQAVLFDVNAMQLKAMSNVLVLIDEAKTPEEFIERFAQRYDQWVTVMPRQEHPTQKGRPHPRQTAEDRRYFATFGIRAQPQHSDEIIDRLTAETGNEQSWLHPTHFTKIKEMVAGGKIAVATMDLADAKRTKVMQDWISASGFRVRDAYISSLLLFMHPQKAFDYYSRPKPDLGVGELRNLCNLLDEDTHVLVSAGDQAKKNAEFVLRVGKKSDFEQILHSWLAMNPGPMDKHYQYMFQFENRGMQISSMGPPRSGTLTLVVKPEKGVFSPHETAAVNRAIGTQMRYPLLWSGDNAVIFSVPSADLENRDFFAGMSSLVNAALAKAVAHDVRR